MHMNDCLEAAIARNILYAYIYSLYVNYKSMIICHLEELTIISDLTNFR